MHTAIRNTKSDFRRTLTCAALATITSLGMFSLIANVMTPMFAGIQWLSATGQPQQTQAVRFEDTVCVQAAHIDDATETARPSAI
jgi:hypothetical protein